MSLAVLVTAAGQHGTDLSDLPIDQAAAEDAAVAVRTPGADRLWEADLGPVMVFLAGTGARFMTGQLIAVNGGLQMLGA
ncbi:hypothetical protein [Streptomyces sp. NPDC002276]